MRAITLRQRKRHIGQLQRLEEWGLAKRTQAASRVAACAGRAAAVGKTINAPLTVADAIAAAESRLRAENAWRNPRPPVAAPSHRTKPDASRHRLVADGTVQTAAEYYPRPHGTRRAGTAHLRRLRPAADLPADFFADFVTDLAALAFAAGGASNVRSMRTTGRMMISAEAPAVLAAVSCRSHTRGNLRTVPIFPPGPLTECSSCAGSTPQCSIFGRAFSSSAVFKRRAL
jgi:hypothetical protein